MSAQQLSLDDALLAASTPGKAHHDGHDTEHAAADSVAHITGRLRSEVLHLLRAHPGGLTDDEGGRLLGGDRLRFGRRRNELCDLGLVCDSGCRRLTPQGRKAVVWVAVA